MKTDQRTKDLEILIVLALAFAVAGRILGVKAADGAAFLLLFTSLAMPKTAAVIAALWLKFGTFLGRINSRLLLALIFYLVLTPTALLHRMFSGKNNALGLRRDPAAGSFWHKIDRVCGREDFEKGW